MAGYVVKVGLTKKDDLIKTWFQMAALSDENASGIISSAIIYFDKTGSYLNVGNISSIETDIENTRKNVYFSEDGEARRILQKTIENSIQKENPGSIIKKLLKKGITTDPSIGNKCISYEDAIEKLDSISKTNPQIVTKVVEPERKQISPPETVVKSKEPEVIEERKTSVLNSKQDYMLSAIPEEFRLGN